MTQNVSVSSGQSFNGQSGLTELTTQETDATQLQTTSVTSHTYLASLPDSLRASGVDVTEIGTTSTDSNGVSLQSIPGSGNGVVDELPHVPAQRWNNAPTRTDTEKDPSGQSDTITYAGDGTYQEQLAYPEGGNSNATTYSDGSAIYHFPAYGFAAAPASLTLNAPSGGQISFLELVPAANNYAAGFVVPDWYPQMFPVMGSDTYVDEGSTTLPSSCNVGSALQSVSVEKIVETKSRLDIIFGEYETDQNTQYTSASYGLLCEIVNDDLKTYYDYSGQTASDINISQSGVPLVETTVKETLALQSAQLASSMTSRAAARSSQPVFVQPSLARARMIFAGVRARNIRALNTRARSRVTMRATH